MLGHGSATTIIGGGRVANNSAPTIMHSIRNYIPLTKLICVNSLISIYLYMNYTMPSCAQAQTKDSAQHMIETLDQFQRVLLYRVDLGILEFELQRYANERLWSDKSAALADAPIVMYGKQLDSLPPSLRLLGPSSVTLSVTSIQYELGGTMLHFGFTVFREKASGEGTKQVGESMWFYSENGKLPREQ